MSAYAESRSGSAMPVLPGLGALRERASTIDSDRRPSKRPRRVARFLGDSGSEDDKDEDDDVQVIDNARAGRSRGSTSQRDVDAMFAALDGDDDDDLRLPPPLNAATQTAIIDDSITANGARRGAKGEGAAEGNDEDGDGKGKKKRVARPRTKIDEARLVGDKGLRKLHADLKSFKIKGKGHEEGDLRRLMTIYQLWAHQLLPKAPFRETIQTVEKVCHRKGIKYELQILRDEAKGIFRPKAGEASSDGEGLQNGIGGPAEDDSVSVVYRATTTADNSQAGSPARAEGAEKKKRSYFDDIPTSSPGGALSRDAEMRGDDEMSDEEQHAASGGGPADIFFSDSQPQRNRGDASHMRAAHAGDLSAGFSDADLTFDFDDEGDDDAEAELAMMEMEQEQMTRPKPLQPTNKSKSTTVVQPAPSGDDDFDFDFDDEEDMLRDMAEAERHIETTKPASTFASEINKAPSTTSSGPELEFDFDDDLLLEDEEELLKSMDDVAPSSRLESKAVEANILPTEDAVRIAQPAKEMMTGMLDLEDEEDLYS